MPKKLEEIVKAVKKNKAILSPWAVGQAAYLKMMARKKKAFWIRVQRRGRTILSVIARAHDPQSAAKKWALSSDVRSGDVVIIYDPKQPKVLNEYAIQWQDG